MFMANCRNKTLMIIIHITLKKCKTNKKICKVIRKVMYIVTYKSNFFLR